MLIQALKRAIIRKNYTSKDEMANKLSLLYSAGKLSVEQFMMLMELLSEGDE